MEFAVWTGAGVAMEKLVLKVKEEEVAPGLIAHVVRNGRKVFAKVFGPNKWHTGWNVEIHSVGQTFMSKEEAFAYVRRNAEAKLEFCCIDADVELVEV